MSMLPKFRRAVKTAPTVDAQRVESDMLLRYSFTPALTPKSLVRLWDAFDAGYLAEFALAADTIERRDDILLAVAPKRRRAASRLPWEVVAFDESPEAARQKEVLESFVDTLEATNAADEDERGGIKLLIRYMLDSVGMRWSVQEIVWKPSPSGLRAEFRKVPLWFFEHRRSRLRYLTAPGAIDGIDLEPGGWLVTRGEGLMMPCSALYVIKHLPLRDFLLYARRYVVPLLHGRTDAAKGTAEWDNMLEALRNVDLGHALLTNKAGEVAPIDVSARGELPYPKLIEYANRGMTVLWRGADLSTLSSVEGQGTGASIQAGESDILVEDDVELVCETFKRQVTPYVIRYALGTDDVRVELRLVPPAADDTKLQLEIDGKLIEWGCPVSQADLLERYNRPTPAGDEPLATPGRAGILPAFPNARLPAPAPARARLLAEARQQLAPAVARDLAPFWAELANILRLPDDKLAPALAALRAELPNYLRRINADPASAAVLENTMAAALLNGYAEAATSRAAVESAGVESAVPGRSDPLPGGVRAAGGGS